VDQIILLNYSTTYSIVVILNFNSKFRIRFLPSIPKLMYLVKLRIIAANCNVITFTSWSSNRSRCTSYYTMNNEVLRFPWEYFYKPFEMYIIGHSSRRYTFSNIDLIFLSKRVLQSCNYTILMLTWLPLRLSSYSWYWGITVVIGIYESNCGKFTRFKR